MLVLEDTVSPLSFMQSNENITSDIVHTRLTNHLPTYMYTNGN